MVGLGDAGPKTGLVTLGRAGGGVAGWAGLPILKFGRGGREGIPLDIVFDLYILIIG